MAALTFAAFAAPKTIVDFTSAHHGWAAVHHTQDAAQRPEGLAFTVTDNDPWIFSPAVTLATPPANTKRMKFTLTCAPTDCKTSWQLFYGFGHARFNEIESCHLQPVGDAPYTTFEAEIPCGKFRNPCRFRLDPPGLAGAQFTVKSLSVDFRSPLWTYHPAPAAPLVIPAATPLVLKGKDWELRHDPDRIGAFRFLSRGKTVENLPHEPFVYLDRTGQVRTLDWESVQMKTQLFATHLRLVTSATCQDADGRTWTLKRTFAESSSLPATLDITTTIRVSAPAEVLHLPALTLFVDRHSQGHKHQALLPGVEYLADEPSSNDKEIRTPEHNRLIPAPHCISLPLAVFTDSQNWLAAKWQQSATPTFATVFDTPDRQFRSGGHLLGFWAPTVGPSRNQSELDIYHPQSFRETTHTLALRTGSGAAVADVLAQQFTSAEQLPPPDPVNRRTMLEQLAHGWLDSQIRQGTQVKHAIGGSFRFQSAADVPFLMRYLAALLERETPPNQELISRLRTVAAEMLNSTPANQIGHSGVSHIRRPAPPLVGGDVRAWLAAKATEHRGINHQLASGKRIWRAPDNSKVDLGSTLGSDHCNGYTSMQLASLLKAAVWSGDEKEIAKTLAIVDKVTELYHGTVPRGAQPWEMPLHCPDIMASANLAQAYSLAYRLKPDPKYLAEARHWAYSGLSMVYLDFQLPDSPLTPPVGTYATCAVMGATHWVAPNWIGRPVQWCGLVYSAALWDLARIDTADASTFWRRIATGITHSGARQNHLAAQDPQFVGLLPDSWDLTRQTRFPIPINPGTVQENFAEAIDLPFYSLGSLDATTLLHVPGKSRTLSSDRHPLHPHHALGQRASRPLQCLIECWPETPFKVVATRIAPPRAVSFNGVPVPHEYDAAHRTLIITLPARAQGALQIQR